MEDDLIDYYEANRILYDTGSSEFKNIDKKKQIKDIIAKRLKISGRFNRLHYRSLVTRSIMFVCSTCGNLGGGNVICLWQKKGMICVANG